MADLSGLFSPERVAVIGATDRVGSVGRAVVENLRATFAGDVVPVNPNRETVFGEPCVPDVASAGDVDLAVVVVPPNVAVEVVAEAAEAGVTNVVVIAAGFGESGGEGARRERELERIAAAHDLNLVGPNCLGVLSTPVGLNATFAPTNARPGTLSFLSQSGAVVSAVLDWANDRGIGFKDVVSLGNKAVLDEIDFVQAWDDDPGTDVVLGYLESIEDGRAFVDRVREVTQTTPVVLVKGGRTEAGASAASSHTGAIAGSDRAYEAGLAQAGVLRVATLEELFDVARALAGQPLPESDAVAIVTNAGGVGVLATDAVGEAGLSLASFEDETRTALDSALPPAANRHNPVDVLGDADADRFDGALDAVLGDPNVGAAAVLASPTAILPYDDLAGVVADRQRQHGKPVVTSLMGGERVRSAERILGETGVPNYFDPARAIRGLDALARYRDIRSRERTPPRPLDVDRERARSVLDRARERDVVHLGVEAMDLLDAYGIPTPDGRVVTAPDEAVATADAIDGPVAMKIVSPDILHKTDVGGVEVGVPRDAAADTFEDLVTRAYRYSPDATVLGVLVQEAVDVDAGVETIVGATRDPQFGPLVLFGLGGIFVEVLEDASFRVAPVTDRDAREMVDGIRASPILHGTRGRDPVDVDGIVDVVRRISQLATDFPAILELDVNPLVATPAGVTAVDLRLTVDRDRLAGTRNGPAGDSNGAAGDRNGPAAAQEQP